jgi:hypothetical protein
VVGSQQRDQSTSLQLLGDSPGADGEHAAIAVVGRRCTRAEEHHVVAMVVLGRRTVVGIGTVVGSKGVRGRAEGGNGEVRGGLGGK